MDTKSLSQSNFYPALILNLLPVERKGYNIASDKVDKIVQAIGE